MADNNNNIELRLNVDVGDAQKAIDVFAKSTEKAFSSSDKKVQQTGVSLQRVTSNIQKATSELNRMNTTSVPTERYTQMQQRLESIQQRAAQARRELESMNRLETPQYTAITQDIDRISRELQTARVELGQFINQGVTSGQAFNQADAEVQRLTNELGVAVNRQIQLEQLGQQYAHDPAYDLQAQRVQNYERVIQSVTNQLQIMQSTGSGMQLLSDADPERAEMLANRISASVNQGHLLSRTIEESNVKTSRLASMWGTVSTAITNAGSRLRQYMSNLRSTTNLHGVSFKKMLTQVLKYAFGIRSIFLLYRKLRTEIKNGMKSLGKDFPEIQAQIDSLSSSWWAFRSSLTSAFQPIFSYVVPALITLIDYLTSAMNALANFFALLTNQGYYYKAVKGNTNVANSVSSTGKAAKEANEELGEYDKLLVIDQDKGGSGGGGGGGAGDSNAYNWEKVPTEASDFVEKLKQAWNDGDWEGLGSLISKRLTDMIEGIPWESIYKKASNFGKGLAQFLNGLITPDLFSAVGGAIAGALNTALAFLKNFGETFDWSNLGNSIAAGINRFFNDFKWAEAAQTLSTWANGLLTAITSALQGVDWFKVGESIVTFITNIDYEKLAGNIATVLLALLNAAFQLVFGMASQLAEDIGKFLEDLGVDGAEGFWKGISDNIKDSAKWVKDIFTKVIDAVKEFFGISSPSKKFAEIGGYCIDGLKKGLGDAVSAIGNWIKENVVNKILDAFDKVKEITTTIKGKIDDTFNTVKEAWDDFKDKAVELLAEAKEKAGATISLLKDAWDNWTPAVKELITEAKEKAGNLISTIKDKWDTGWTTTKELFTEAKEKVAGALNGLKTLWNSINDKNPALTASATDASGGVINTLKTAWDTIKTETRTLTGTAVNNASKTIESLRTAWKTVKTKTAKLTAKATKKNKSTFNSILSDWKSVVSKTVTATVNLAKGNWNTVSKWLVDNFGASTATQNKDGSVTVRASIRKLGGILNSATGLWKNIPQYAGGTARAHGSMFIAGEAGPEVVGHVNGRTEVLNRSQIASSIYSAVVSGIKTALSTIPSFNMSVDLSTLQNLPPIPVVVTGQLLPLTEAFMFKFDEQHKDFEDIKSQLDEIITRLSTVESSNHEPIMLQLDGKTIVQLVWDATQKRYKQTGKPMFA